MLYIIRWIFNTGVIAPGGIWTLETSRRLIDARRYTGSSSSSLLLRLFSICSDKQDSHITRAYCISSIKKTSVARSMRRSEAARLSILRIVNDTKTGKLEIRSKLSPWNPLYQFRIGVWNSLRIIKDVSSLSFVRFDAILNAFLDFLIVLKCNKLCFVKHNEIRKITYNFSQ